MTPPLPYATVQLAAHPWRLYPSGLAYWEEQKLAVVSDLHLSKGASLASHGSFIPPYDSQASLKKLESDFALLSPEILLFLGDTYHDASGEALLDPVARASLQSICQRSTVVWVIGNHDRLSAAQMESACETYLKGPFAFRHHPTLPSELPTGQYELAGHLHPKARMRTHGKSIRRTCFIETPRQLILPAYGAYTGGLDIEHHVFDPYLVSGHRVHLTTKRTVLALPPA